MDAVPLEPRQSGTAFAPVINALDAAFSDKWLREINQAGNPKTIKHDGKNVSIQQDKVQSLPLASEFLNGNIKINSLDLAREVKFEIDSKTKTASNITGVTLNLTLFDTPYNMDITKVRLGHDARGQKTLFTEMRNPIPAPGQRVIGMPPSFSVEIPVNGEGGLQAPLMSKVFADAASSTGPSIAGLLTSDALTEASKVALFVESNPKWVQHVVEPALQDILRHLVTKPPAQPEVQIVPPPPQVKPPAVPAVNFPPAGQPGHDAGKLVPAPFVPVPAKIDVTKPGDYLQTMTIEGAERKYHVHVPPSYNGKTPMPMVLLLHGHGQDGKTIAHHTRFNEMSDREGFIAVYPDARSWAGRDEWRAWDTDNGLIPPGSNADDVAFMRGIIDRTESDYKIDPKRIYMAGLSNGGMMSFRAAGDLSDKLAAIAVVSGAMSGTEPSPKHPLSVMNIHGTEDGIVPYEGLKNVPASLSAIGLPRFKPMDYTTNYWVEQNKITNPPIVLRNKDVIERRFINPTNGAEVNEYTINGGRHVPDQIDQLTGEIWKFFASHPKAEGQTSGTLQLPTEEPFNITKRLKQHMQTRGITGLQVDAGQMLNELPLLRDGSVSPSQTIKDFEKQSGITLGDTASLFLKSTNSVAKQGDRITIEMAAPQDVKINSGGPVNVKSVRIENTAFNLYTERGRTSLTDISGISVNVNALGRDLSVPVKAIAQKIDGAGEPYYRVKTQNPMGSLSRAVLFADKDVPIELKFNDQGDSRLVNDREFKDAALGLNPVTRGYINIGQHGYSLATNPTWGSGLHVAKDVGIMGGSSFAAYKLAALKFGTKGRVGAALTAGLIVAPAVIHGVERLIGND
jgi:polyhydroxybutyrate depolymerase